MKIFGERLKELREGKGLSRVALSKQLGISSVIIYYWETNARNVTDENLVKLAKFFGVTTDYLLGLQNY